MVKRAAEKQLTRENAADSEGSANLEDVGPRPQASAEVLAQRKILKVAKKQAIETPASPVNKNSSPSKTESVSLSPSPRKEISANPFAALLTASPVPASPTASAACVAPRSIFGETSKFTGNLFATFGSFGSGPFGRGDAENSESPDEEPQAEEEESSAEVQTFSGEEDERCLYQHDCRIFFLEISDSTGRWVERGSGFVRVLENEKTSAKRLVVRMKGVLKILLNTPVMTSGYKAEGLKSVKFKALQSHSQTEESGSKVAWVRLNLLQEGQQDAFVKAAFGETLDD